MNWFKKIFRKKKDNLPISNVSKHFCITYCEDGNLENEKKWEMWATSETMARYDFWDRFNELYTDILDVNVC